MKARLVRFGEIEVAGQQYDFDVVIDRGDVRRREKAASKPWRDAYGHTPLSIAEAIPWGGAELIVGTGADGRLPIMPDVLDEARRRGIEVLALPTAEACEALGERKRSKVRAILHVTC
jgi:hypothetical protein